MSHYLGIHGASADPNGRFRTMVKIMRTAPIPHQWMGFSTILVGFPAAARTIQRTQSTAKIP